MNIPYEGVRSHLQDLPFVGPDLFSGKFLETREAEAKQIDCQVLLSPLTSFPPTAETETPYINLFTQLPIFCSLFFRLRAWAVDALQTNWSGMSA